MPGGDRTGPLGLGPRSGRGTGYCAGNGAPGYMNSVPFFGYGYGRGQGAGFGQSNGRGFRGRCLRRPFSGGYQYSAQQYIPVPNYTYNNQPDPQDEKAYLSSEAKILKDQLSQIEKRLSELEGSESEG